MTHFITKLFFICFHIVLISTQDVNTDASNSCYFNPELTIEPPLRIGAWNVARLGKGKVDDPLISDYIAKIILRYDIIGLQEVTDKTEEYVREMLLIVNEKYVEQTAAYDKEDYLKEPLVGVYDVLISKRVGGTRYKEQYAVFYRTDKVSVVDSFNYMDELERFQYDPYVVVFNTPTLKHVSQLPVITIHTSPTRAVEEIDALIDVYDLVSTQFGLKDAIIMGDFNAGCGYVRGKKWSTLKLYNDDRFQWLISDHIDTTVKYTTCPYDRIVIAGENLTKTTYTDSAQAFHFDEEFNIRNKNLTKNISDHFPVEVLLKGKLKTKLDTDLRIKVSSNVPSEEVRRLFQNCQELENFENPIMEKLQGCIGSTPLEEILDRIAYIDTAITAGEPCADVLLTILDEVSVYRKAVKKCFARPSRIHRFANTSMITITSKTTDEIYEILNMGHSSHRCLFNEEMISILKHKIEGGVLRDASLYLESDEKKDLEYFCVNDHLCSITVSMMLNVA